MNLCALNECVAQSSLFFNVWQHIAQKVIPHRLPVDEAGDIVMSSFVRIHVCVFVTTLQGPTIYILNEQAHFLRYPIVLTSSAGKCTRGQLSSIRDKSKKYWSD